MCENPGTVIAIHIAAEHGEPTQSVDAVEAVAGAGLRGDRHFDPAGPPGNQLTLIEAEQLEDFTTRTGLQLTAAESRRQLITYAIRLNPLVGRRFMVGDVECRGIELCEPCRHLERMTRHGVLEGMVHRAGLNAEILSGGEIAIGARVRPLGD
jgi:MOSC domain-containing protein YiiM